MYRIFEAVLSINKMCIAIGISFRDDNIRKLVENRLEDKQFRLVIVAPEEAEYPELIKHIQQFGQRDNVTWIKGYFGKDEISSQIIKQVQQIDSK